MGRSVSQELSRTRSGARSCSTVKVFHHARKHSEGDREGDGVHQQQVMLGTLGRVDAKEKVARDDDLRQEGRLRSSRAGDSGGCC
jgi:hypothetical protein